MGGLQTGSELFEGLAVVNIVTAVEVVASFPVSTPSFFLHVVKKSGREPGQIRHVKCVISAGRVRGFVECSDLAALLVHVQSRVAASFLSSLVKEPFAMKDKTRG